MDKYRKVEKPRPEIPINENGIRITTQGIPRNYISYATTLLGENGRSVVVLKAMGKAISKRVTIAEIIKRRIPNLHQNIVICSLPTTILWEPLEEGLLPFETTRHVSMITITLSTRHLDTSSAGYQPPPPVDQVKPPPEIKKEGDDSLQNVGLRGTGRGRNVAAPNFHNGDVGRSYGVSVNGWSQGGGHFHGRARGRTFPRRARGSYGSDPAAQHANGKFNDNVQDDGYGCSVAEGEVASGGRGGGRERG